MSLVLTRQYTNIAGLVLLVYDHVITWDKEVNRIWRSSDILLKIMFFLGRYWALAFQIINLTVTHPHMLKKEVVNCYKWFGFQNSGVGILLVNFQIILMLRVYALYERSRRMGAFLIFWFVFYTIMMVTISRTSVHLLKLDWSCMMMEAPSPKTTIAFSVMCILDQCILWGLTANKYRDAIRCGWSTNPLMRLVMRDTSWSALAVCLVLIATLPYSLMINQIGHIVYCLLSSLVSVLTCRTILNMRGLNNPSGPLSIDITTVDLELTDLPQSE